MAIAATMAVFRHFPHTIMQVHNTLAAVDYRRRRTINPQHRQEVQYWAGQFDVPASTLIEVVREVGRNVAEVRKRFATV